VRRALCAIATAVPLLPAPGHLLVEGAPYGAAIVEQDGTVRPLGEWYETAFAPDGSAVVGARGDRVAVLDLDGRVRWRLRTSPSPSGAQPDWASDGRRIAYRYDADLRVVGARGFGDRRVAGGLRFAGPRWRPGSPHVLAWADRRGSVRTLDVLTGRTLWRSGPGPPIQPAGLRWSPDGTRLAAIAGSLVRVFDASGRVVRRLRAGRRHGHFQTGAFTSAGLVLVQHDFRAGRSRVTLGEREILVRRGSTVDVTASPDGRYLLLGRRTADEWRFEPLSPGLETEVVEGVTHRIHPRAGGRWAFPATRGWSLSA
jgi:Tol biopolymer transport system component